jgi:hypothetical protein
MSVPVAASYANPAELRASGEDAGVSCVHTSWLEVTTVDGDGVAVAVACGRGVGVADGDVEPHAAIANTTTEPTIHHCRCGRSMPSPSLRRRVLLVTFATIKRPPVAIRYGHADAVNAMAHPTPRR